MAWMNRLSNNVYGLTNVAINTISQNTTFKTLAVYIK